MVGREDLITDLSKVRGLDVAAGIVSAMEVELAPSDRRRLNSGYVANVEAYDEFLRGLDHQGRRSPDDSLSARAHFRKTIVLNPSYGDAYVLLGWILDSAGRP